jgi:hypothetical protein
MASKSLPLPGGAPNTPPNGPPPSNPQSAKNLVAFDPKQAVPQQPIYLQRNDYIGFNFLTSLLTAQVRVNYRFLTPEGEIKEGELDTAVFNGAGFFEVEFYEGWLLSFSARVTSATFAGFFCFMQALVFRSITTVANGNFHGIFWQGYIPALATNGWPGTPTKEVTDGAGVIRTFTQANPGAGVDWLIQVPAGRRWTLLSLRAELVTSAAAANRFPIFKIFDATGNTLWSVGPNAAQLAALAVFYNLGPGLQFYNDTQNDIILPLPAPTEVKSNYIIQAATTALQAGDQWFTIQASILEWGLWDS